MQQEVAGALAALGLVAETGILLEGGQLSIDVALPGARVAILTHSADDFTSNEPLQPLGQTVLRRRLIASRAWTVGFLNSMSAVLKSGKPRYM